MFDEEPIARYTIKNAEEDGILFDITQINKEWKQGLFSHITTNLLENGYLIAGVLNIPNLLDLLNQSILIVKKKSNNFKEYDTFFKGKVEFPDGTKKDIFICKNEIGKFTIMLPEDY